MQRLTQTKNIQKLAVRGLNPICMSLRAISGSRGSISSGIPEIRIACRSSDTLVQSLRIARIPMRSYSSLPPHTVIKMPALSPTMTQGNLGRWHKKIGDEIKPGDILVEIETDKAQMDFECQDEGFLAKILLDSGNKDVPVNTPIAVFVEDKGDIDKFKDFSAKEAAPAKPAASKPEAKEAPKATAAPSTSSPAAPQSSSGKTFASPIAKELAGEKGIALNQVAGSGPDGLVIKKDVLGFKPATQPATKLSAPPAASAATFKDLPLSNVRKVIAARLSESKSTIPHYYLTVTISADKLLKVREMLNAEANGAYKLSINDFIVKASGLALKDVPEVNSSWGGDFIRQYTTADVAVAVATPAGLITPIVPAVEQKGIASISNKIKDLAGRAKENKLQPQEYQGGTFTISNLGMFGVDFFTAIINPPHAGILAVGATTERVTLDGDKPVITREFKVTGSFDHRVVDGAVGAKFLGKIKAYLENPLNLML